MNYEATQILSQRQFKRRFGVPRSTFNRMLKGLKTQLPELPHPSRPPKLSIEDQILVALEYWREYRTYFHIATDRGVSESTICRIVHRVEADLMASGISAFPARSNWFEALVARMWSSWMSQKRRLNDLNASRRGFIPAKTNHAPSSAKWSSTETLKPG